MSTGVLVMAHGTPAAPEELEAFYTRIRRGRPPSPEQLDELRARYDAIGGVSPLSARTAAQVAALEAALARHGERRYVVRLGAKHTEPFVEDAAAALVGAGVDSVVGLVLTPHGSSMGSGEYLARARAALDDRVQFVPIDRWYAHPGFVRLMAGRVHHALDTLGSRTAQHRCPVVFTAHSLPTRVVESGDTYPEQLEESAHLVAEEAALTRWSVAWQSAGRTPEPWLGPDVRDVVRRLAETARQDAVVICPIGFVADHLEVLYDIDVELAAIAGEVGLRMVRTASLNEDPAFIDVLADEVRHAVERAGCTP